MGAIMNFLSTPISLLTAIGSIFVWFLLDVIFHGKLRRREVIMNLISGAVFIFLAYDGNLTVGLGVILIIPLSILSDYLGKIVFKKENGDGNN